MDCLDRTNVVQSELAKIFLKRQFCDLDIMGPKENLELTGEFIKIFKNGILLSLFPYTLVKIFLP